MYMFDMLDLFISSHLYILMVVCTCLLLYSHPYILISLGSYALTRIPASSYPQFGVCLLITSCSYILLSCTQAHVFCVLVGNFRSSHPHPQVHVLRVFVGILTFSYPQVHVLQVLVDILASSHSHIPILVLVQKIGIE